VTRDAIHALIDAERARQERLKAEGKLRATCLDPIDEAVKLAALTEEVGEVARAVLGRSAWSRDGGDLTAELVQVAAVCVAWLESLPLPTARQVGLFSEAHE
jgi:NTP pyrophosphatase (non-canonical NTP hydrolase)